MKIMVQTESVKEGVKIRKTVEVFVSESGVKIGRQNAEILVEDSHCSKSHARLVLGTDGSLYVEDTQSRNGTYINGQRIDRAMIPKGALFRIGRSTLRILSLSSEILPANDGVVCRGWPHALECMPKKEQDRFSNYM